MVAGTCLNRRSADLSVFLSLVTRRLSSFLNFFSAMFLSMISL